VGIFGVEPEPFAEFAGRVLKKKINWQTDVDALREACKDEKVRRATQKELDRIAKEFKFIRYEW